MGKQIMCQRIGCDALFDPTGENPTDACQYHPGPLFHDGNKEWSCCKQKSYDFSLFMQLPGCQKGPHSAEKPPKPEPKPVSMDSKLAAVRLNDSSSKPAQLPASKPSSSSLDKSQCQRCRQGFYCSEHAAVPGTEASTTGVSLRVSTTPLPSLFSSHNDFCEGSAGLVEPKAKKEGQPVVATNQGGHSASSEVDLDAQRVCRNKGCGASFTERENSDTTCKYHPGPAVFHDRKKGWACCNVHVNDFDEFMTIAPCTVGRHSAG
eukprot:jgi/Chlat1/4378/Chrsp29S04612